jgi:hypothetical protein
VTRLRLAALAVVVGVACRGTEPRQPEPSPEPTRAGRPACAAPGTGLQGFVLVSEDERRYPDHVGARMEFRDPEGRRIFFLLGIPGEVGEGLPLVGEPSLVDGTPARLLGEVDRWVLAWEGEPPCRDMAIVGNEIGRSDFEAVLREASILP